MKNDIKTEILEAGFRLFSEQGYANVSMRNIADSLGMSVGNLTYHFKKKEDLIEAVIIEKSVSFIKPTTPTTLKELNDYFLLGVEHQKRDDYLFRYYDQLARISPKVYAIHVGIIKKRKKMLQDSFEILQQKGYINREEIPGHRDALIDVINMIKIYWVPSQEALNSAKDSPMDCLWSIIYPLLTEKGKVAFNEDVQI